LDSATETAAGVQAIAAAMVVTAVTDAAVVDAVVDNVLTQLKQNKKDELFNYEKLVFCFTACCQNDYRLPKVLNISLEPIEKIRGGFFETHGSTTNMPVIIS
jgi:hypothetical protein